MGLCLLGACTVGLDCPHSPSGWDSVASLPIDDEYIHRSDMIVTMAAVISILVVAIATSILGIPWVT